MSYLIVCSVALLASALTFFSGFGLGTLLLPAFALFFPVGQAVALTAVVHFLNGLFKLTLTARHGDRRVVLLFGLPACAMALVGAWLLTWLADTRPLLTYVAAGHAFDVTPVKLVIGFLLLAFALLDLVPRFRSLAFGARYLPLGGLLSGFLGGLAGMQGALRSAFLARAGLTKEGFIGTGVVIACLIDFSRLAIYSTTGEHDSVSGHVPLLGCAVAAAFLGAIVGNRTLKKITLPGVQRIVAVMLMGVSVGLMAGVL